MTKLISAPRRTSNFALVKGEVKALTPVGVNFLTEGGQEEEVINGWLDTADEAVSNDQALPPRPKLSPLGEELLGLIWPED